MKKLLLLLPLLMLGLLSTGQTVTYYGTTTTNNNMRGALVVDSFLKLPKTNGTPAAVPSWYKGTKGGLAKYDTATGYLYVHNGTSWQQFTSGGGGSSLTYQTLTDASTVTWDYSSGQYATVTLGGNRTLSLTNATAPCSGILWVVPNGHLLSLPGLSSIGLRWPVSDTIVKIGFTKLTSSNISWDYGYYVNTLTQLSTPTLTATASDSVTVGLSWTNVSNESSYAAYFSTDNSSWTQIGGTIAANTTTYSHTGRSPATLYYYRVKAVGDGVTYSDSNYGTDTATTAAGGGNPELFINWDFSSGAVSDADLGWKINTGTFNLGSGLCECTVAGGNPGTLKQNLYGLDTSATYILTATFDPSSDARGFNVNVACNDGLTGAIGTFINPANPIRTFKPPTTDWTFFPFWDPAYDVKITKLSLKKQ